MCRQTPRIKSIGIHQVAVAQNKSVKPRRNGNSGVRRAEPPAALIRLAPAKVEMAIDALRCPPNDANIETLSGGEKRRIALARLLLRKDAPLWLLDEPTEGLDTRTARDLLGRLAHEARQRQCSLVIATHLRREAELADRLLCIQGGRLVADHRRGTPAFESALGDLRQD